ncbi:DUF349 domain-containing protein [Marixanthomonas ophiurae]|uniref:DUF349 domain-containing protein n=1 Tax=Marixanthomonas ophiurae TaxID=387659 RepID=A0A3E1Q6L2_9FLAO|nr:DUF349 domain-containing protein [Marixanthomonas ophiurae]RFN57759.1 DUF349 domain-containing protein [Marixanthomonas ophiurae]
MSDEKTAKEKEKKTVSENNEAINTSEKEVEKVKDIDKADSKEDTEVLENALVDESTKTKAPKEKLSAEEDSSEEQVEKLSEEKTEKKTAPKEEVTSDKAETEKVSNEKPEEEDEEEEEEITSSDDDEKEHEEEDEGKDYSELSKKELISEFKSLLKDNPVQKIKNEVEEIRSEFNSKFNELLEQKKEEFLADGGNVIDFQYTTPLKKDFNSLYFDYKEKRNKHYKNLKRDLHANLEKRQNLIEELKGLLNAEESMGKTYNHFKDIQKRWHEAGAIPRDKYNLVWNNYHHHVENFYDFLHLNREFRDMDFKHNLEQKLKLIGRAEELAQEQNINKAFRELQMLHKMWKEDVGPVAKEYREDVWDKFSEATKVIHDKRHAHLEEQEKEYEANYEVKKDLINQIKQISENTKPSHQAWQHAIKKVQELRDAYFAAGKVPRALNKGIWNAFKDATRTFNRTKNAYYKDQKKEQYANLEKKRELVKIAEDNKDSDDTETTTPLMKKIQADWKKIGHVPRKYSDKIWKQFKAACNHYFDRLHAQKDEEKEEEKEHYAAKESLLERMNNLDLSGDHKEDLKTIKANISEWKKIGRVPYKKRNIEQKFNKTLDGLFNKLDLSKKDAELIKFENKLNTLSNRDDERKLKNEHFFISKKINETKDEIRQLENNLSFFKHVDDDNPLVKEVHNNIAKHKEQLEVWKAKLSKIKSVRDA